MEKDNYNSNLANIVYREVEKQEKLKGKNIEIEVSLLENSRSKMEAQVKKQKEENLEQELESVINSELVKGRFNGNVILQKYDGKPCFFGRIRLVEDQKDEIIIKYNPKYEQENPGMTKEVIRDLIRHEINHKGYPGLNGCPRTVENRLNLIIEPVAEILTKKVCYSNDIHHLANAFEDTINNTQLSNKFSLDGMTKLFVDVGRHDDGFNPLDAAHVKLNMYLWGNKKQKKELKKYFKHPDKVKEVLENFLARTGIKNFNRDRRAIREFLGNEGNWPKIAKIYAEEFSKLLK